MLKKRIGILLFALSLIFAFVSCSAKQNNPGEQGADGVTPTITISEDGYWVINGQKTNTLATVKEKEFVVGEEILFEEGKEFSLFFGKHTAPQSIAGKQCKVTAKIVAKEEYTLDNPSAWPYPNEFRVSYRYRLHVKGYCPKELAGQTFNYTMSLRFSSYGGATYTPIHNHESTIVGADGYFEFSADVYTSDILTDIVPVDFTTSNTA